MSKKRVFVLLSLSAACLLSFAVFFLILKNGGEDTQVTASGENASATFLFAGVDDAGENTDMLMLCRISKEKGSVHFVQIPRDTFYKTETGKGKINRVYRQNVSKYGKKRAAEGLCAEISRALGIQIDGYVVFDTQTVASFVDLVGGVRVDVPCEIRFFDGKTGSERIIAQGEQLLSGEEAVAFVRHRKSYVEGDLGRLDAQMRFLGGLSTVLPSLKKIDRILAIYQKILPNLLTNLTEKDIIEFMMAYLKNGGAYSVLLARLPGEACYTNGAWYYVLHKNATEEMLHDVFGVASGSFDAEGRFTDSGKESLSNIYSSFDRTYRVYTPDEVANKKILHS